MDLFKGFLVFHFYKLLSITVFLIKCFVSVDTTGHGNSKTDGTATATAGASSAAATEAAGASGTTLNPICEQRSCRTSGSDVPAVPGATAWPAARRNTAECG